MTDTSQSMDGKVVWITGSGRGMGREHALLLAQRGADIVVHDVLVDEANETARQVAALGRRVHLSHADVTSPTAMAGRCWQSCARPSRRWGRCGRRPRGPRG